MIQKSVDSSGPFGEDPAPLPFRRQSGEGEEGSGGGGGPALEEDSESASSAAPPPLTVDEMCPVIEAILFSTGEPVSLRQLVEIFEAPVHDVREAVEKLRAELAESQRSFRLEEIAGGLQLLTQTRFYPWILRFRDQRREQRLSAAALETLAVIAYKQPISRAALEEIRGVQCAAILKTLMDRSLVKIAGHEESLGRPILYGTTAHFLETFGLSSLDHLPQPDLDRDLKVESESSSS